MRTQTKKDKINTMNTTLDTLINTINMEINENVIERLSTYGYSQEEATKLVNEYSDFDLVQDAAQFPVENIDDELSVIENFTF